MIVPAEAKQSSVYRRNSHKIDSSLMSHSTDSRMGKANCEIWNKTMLSDLGMSTDDLAPIQIWAMKYESANNYGSDLIILNFMADFFSF